MKKVLMVLSIICLSLISTSVYAAGVNVQLNGDTIDFTDNDGNRVDAQIINGRTMVPMRKIFELLGATVDWKRENDVETVTANKDNVSIKLEINNNTAEITKNGTTQSIVLDSAPVKVGGRTLVPLRFISESLDKQVGWDNENRTAIIIDYDYFLNRIKEKSPLLYEIIMVKPNSTNIQITREYQDLIASTGTTSKVNADVLKTSETSRNIALTFTGNSELFTEIAEEGWNNADVTIDMTDNGISYHSSNNILKKMIFNDEESYTQLNLTGKYTDSFSDMMKKLLHIDESTLNVSTFSSVKNEYDQLLNLFTYSNSLNSATLKASKVNYDNANFTYFDYTKFDNIIFENEFIQVYNAVNQLIFHYDIQLDELLYDTSNVVVNISLSKNGSEYSAVAEFELSNEYQEKVIYTVSITEK